jgi:hypothetical protein
VHLIQSSRSRALSFSLSRLFFGDWSEFLEELEEEVCEKKILEK